MVDAALQHRSDSTADGAAIPLAQGNEGGLVNEPAEEIGRASCRERVYSSV